MTDHGFEQIFPLGAENSAFAAHFTGQSYLAPLVAGTVPVSNVSFEPGCRNDWHIHRGSEGAGDQILLCTAGRGWFQAEGEAPVCLRPGTVIRVPSGTKHWHGAAAGSWFSHLVLLTPGPDVSTDWLEPVTDEEYGALTQDDTAS